jgi:UDP-glucose 4-epimerase
LITGASGFVGQYLVRALHRAHDVHGIYERAESFQKNPEVRRENQHVCDLRLHARLEQLVQYIKPHVVLHLAARSEVAFSFERYREVSEVNYIGTVNLAEANRQHNPALQLFVMASTMETYGHHPRSGGPFNEDTPQRPMAPYAVAKLACEKYLQYMEYAYGFPFTILRQTNAYGRTDNDFFIVERIITQMLRGATCNLGEPEPWRNFLWIGDLVELYEVILTQIDVARGQVFVTGPNNALSIRDLAGEIVDLLDWRGVINWHSIPKRPGEVYYLNSTGAKAREMLGWAPCVELGDGLARTVEIWRGNLRKEAPRPVARTALGGA